MTSEDFGGRRLREKQMNCGRLRVNSILYLYQFQMQTWGREGVKIFENFTDIICS